MSTVLVVDDEFGIADALCELLAAEGYRVVVAHDGREALARVADARPDIVLLDFMMPAMDGGEVLRTLRADPAHRTLPVVLMSGALREHLPRDCAPSLFLQKPFGIDTLLSALRRLLAQAER